MTVARIVGAARVTETALVQSAASGSAPSGCTTYRTERRSGMSGRGKAIVTLVGEAGVTTTEAGSTAGGGPFASSGVRAVAVATGT